MRDRVLTGRMLLWALMVLIALAAFGVALAPINSNDIWWHLKTGDYIRATGALPAIDPFSYLPAIDTVDPARPQLILRQYWLAQLFYSLVHAAAGLSGILLARATLCAGMVLATAVFLFRSTREYIGLVPILPLILSLRVILEDSDRPHLFAFAGALLVLLILESSLRAGWRRPLYLLPPLQLLLAQFHPGFVVGTLIIVVYALCAGWEPRLRETRRLLWGVAGLCLLLFFLNPNGILLVPALFGVSSGVGAAISLEFQSPLAIWRYVATDLGWLACAALIFLSLPATGLLLKNQRWSAALVLIGLTLAALFSMRYIGFFTPVASAFIGQELGRLYARKIPRWGEGLLAVGLLMAVLAMLVLPGHANRAKINQLLQPGYFPVRGADFLAREEVRDNLFNFDAWGGYLEYRLWPRHAIFTDTRILTNDAAVAYREILNDTRSGRDLMQLHAINTVILPPLDIYTGEVFPLVRRLSAEPEWSLIHFDDTALIFARQPHRQPSLAKEMVWFQVLRQVNTWQPRFPWAPGYQRAHAEATMKMRGG